MPCSNLRFLLVEDHPFQRQMLARLLTTLGSADVHEAEDGNGAMEVLTDAQRPVDIVISDVDMPGMDGLELVRRISENCDSVSLILASAVDRSLLASVANMSRAYGVNLLGVIGKPASAAKLAPLIAKHRRGIQPPAVVDGAPRFSSDEIAQAWKRDEFEPWFEPAVDMQTGKIAGFSAVARWRHPQLDALAPDDFLASVHARGLGDRLGWLMLRKSASHCREWRLAGHPLTLSVSLAFDSLTAPGFAAQVEEVFASQQLDPSAVVLTIAEGALRTGLPHALENLARLRINGFGLGIDDFGDGLMATQELALVAFTQLKIKRSFVDGALGMTDLAGIAVGLELAAQMNVPSVASGVVSRQKWDLLREWGCSFAQGSFVGAPMAAAGVAPWLAARQAA